jgi:tRNA (guanine37-N1)-methyltransferase
VRQFHVVTLFPEMFTALDYGIVGRALKANLLKLNFWNPRDYTSSKQGRVDDHPYGGGPGMVLQVQPLRAALNAVKTGFLPGQKCRVIYLSPQGKLFTQKTAEDFAARTVEEQFILILGRYEGIDERVIAQDVDEEWSIGNYVLSGGELAAMVMIDAIARLLPEALGDPASAYQESFHQDLLDYPHYTRPESIEGQKVPDVLLSGSHAAIARFRLQQALGKTWLKRPDLLKNRSLNAQEIILLQEFIQKMRNPT